MSMPHSAPLVSIPFGDYTSQLGDHTLPLCKSLIALIEWPAQQRDTTVDLKRNHGSLLAGGT